MQNTALNKTYYFNIHYTVNLNQFYNKIKYKMDRFGFGNRDDDKSQDSGVSIDWDAYDKINNDKEDKPEDRGEIEVPADSETVIYESPDGQTYEIPLSDLIDADDDNEIKYTSGKKKSGSLGKRKFVSNNKRNVRYIRGNSFAVIASQYRAFAR